jgi:hypothetical protein
MMYTRDRSVTSEFVVAFMLYTTAAVTGMLETIVIDSSRGNKAAVEGHRTVKQRGRAPRVRGEVTTDRGRHHERERARAGT